MQAWDPVELRDLKGRAQQLKGCRTFGALPFSSVKLVHLEGSMHREDSKDGPYTQQAYSHNLAARGCVIQGHLAALR